MPQSAKSPEPSWTLLGLGAALAILLACAVGPTHFGVGAAWEALLGRGDPTRISIVRDLRLPRALLAFLVGGGLAACGAALQALVRNPLADPYLLGLSGGAGLGAVLAIAAGVGGAWSVPLAAFLGAVAAVAVVYRLGIVGEGWLDTRVLLLAGVVVGAFAVALMGAVMALSPAPQIRNALNWVLGSFSAASWLSVSVFATYASVPLGALYLMHRSLDLLSLGEEPAGFLGVDVERVKRALYGVASALTAAAVAVSGIIGFVGLVIPHLARISWGHQHRILLPSAFLLGGILLVLADAVARVTFAPLELPVGVVTALIGVPVFVSVLRRWSR